MIYIVRSGPIHRAAIHRLRSEGIDFSTSPVDNTGVCYIQADDTALTVLFPYLIEYWLEPDWWRGQEARESERERRNQNTERDTTGKLRSVTGEIRRMRRAAGYSS